MMCIEARKYAFLLICVVATVDAFTTFTHRQYQKATFGTSTSIKPIGSVGSVGSVSPRNSPTLLNLAKKSESGKKKTSAKKKKKTRKVKTKSKTVEAKASSAKTPAKKKTRAKTTTTATATATAAKKTKPVEKSTPPPVVVAKEQKQQQNDGDSELEGSDVEKSTQILKDIEDGNRDYPGWFYEEYLEEKLDDLEEDDDPSAIDPETLGKWDESDLQSRLEYEFDISKGDPDPNVLNPKFEHIQEVEVDEEGVEKMYDPIFGRANPIDERTIINPQDSYVIDDETRDDKIVTPTFPEGDLEVEYNAEITNYRKSLKIVETYIDPFLKMEVPRHKAKWYGYPEETSYPEKPDIENRFTKPEDKTDFDSMTPYRARKKAVELARAKNNEWLPAGTSVAFHNSKTDVYGKLGLTVGSLKRGEIDEELRNEIQPALDVLGSSAELIETNDTVFRFHYHGLIKNKRGMAAWTQTLIRDCGVECTGVVFETGWRKRDPYYDGGDKWFGPY